MKPLPKFTKPTSSGQRDSYCSLANLTSEGKDTDRPKFEVSPRRDNHDTIHSYAALISLEFSSLLVAYSLTRLRFAPFAIHHILSSAEFAKSEWRFHPWTSTTKGEYSSTYISEFQPIFARGFFVSFHRTALTVSALQASDMKRETYPRTFCFFPTQ